MININNEDFIDINNTSFVNGLSYITINRENYIVKRLNKQKIDLVFSGDYILLAREYIRKLNEIIPCVEDLGLLNFSDYIYEIQRQIDDNLFVDNNNIFYWRDILNLYKNILEYITEIKKVSGLGIDTAIWNFSINGQAFDFSPPRLINNINRELFTRKNDKDHYIRTYYRCMTDDGMRLSLLTSLLHTIYGKKIIIVDINNISIEQVINELLLSSNNKDYLVNNLCNSEFKSFNKHPINVIQDYIGVDNLCRILK